MTSPEKQTMGRYFHTINKKLLKHERPVYKFAAQIG